MSRAYRGIRPKRHRVYSVREVQELYAVSRNTVSNWVRSGLRPSDTHHPYLFRGQELQRFHTARRARDRKHLRRGEFKCMGCGNAVFPQDVSVRRSPHILGTGSCPECGAHVTKILNASECDSLQERANPNTSRDMTDEGEACFPACIGIDRPWMTGKWHPNNDRMIHRWQTYAGKYNGKTMDAHLIAIREFEESIEGKPFQQVTPEDADRYRKGLIARAHGSGPAGRLAKSTVAHRAAFLRKFFEWLVEQDNYRRLNKSLPGYFDLPKAQLAKAKPADLRDYPSLEEAQIMVKGMSDATLLDRRDRAIVAMAFLSGFRASALATLRIGFVDLQKRRVEQDATVMRAKNGKSYLAAFFPRTEMFEQAVREWIMELRSHGATDTDAIFPADGELSKLQKRRIENEILLPPKSSSIVTRAFARGSAILGQDVTPHAARHSLKALGDKLCTTITHRKAWSMNLGHSSITTTEQNYAKMTGAEQIDVIAAMRKENPFSEDEKDLMLHCYAHRLIRGTAEFEKAKMLCRAWEDEGHGGEVV